MAGDDEQRQPLLGNESQGDYGASTSGGAPPAAEGESREAMEAREIAYACKTGPGGLSSAEAAEEATPVPAALRDGGMEVTGSEMVDEWMKDDGGL